jgi:hypothetical protein
MLPVILAEILAHGKQEEIRCSNSSLSDGEGVAYSDFHEIDYCRCSALSG